MNELMMAAKKLSLLILLCINFFVKGDDSPVPFITKCQSNDVKCVTKSTQDAISIFTQGIPKFHVENLDPIFIKSLDANSPHLKLYITETKVTGLKGCHVNKMDRSTKGKLLVDVVCNLKLDGQYEMDGNILLLKMQGKGDYNVVVGGLNINLDVDLEEFVGKDGEKYWKVPKWTYVFKVKGQSSLHFENLFNGNDVLGQAARSLFDNSPVEVIEEIGGPIVDYVIKQIVKNANAFFKHVPAKYLSID